MVSSDSGMVLKQAECMLKQGTPDAPEGQGIF
jgi:hypothetical protein